MINRKYAYQRRPLNNLCIVLAKSLQVTKGAKNTEGISKLGRNRYVKSARLSKMKLKKVQYVKSWYLSF